MFRSAGYCLLVLCLVPPGVIAAESSVDLAKAAAGVRYIIAHRGSSMDRPENTLQSTRQAIRAGATAVEVDIRTTSDGHLVLLHDATLERTTDGIGRVGDKTLAEIKQLDAGSWFDAKYQAERVPTLSEVLQLCRDQVDVVLDLKEQGEAYTRAIVEVVRSDGEPQRTIVGVRSVEQAKQFRELLPEARQLGLIPNPESIEAFAEAGVETIRLWPRWLQDASLVPRVRESGARLHLNGTTGLPDETRELLEYQPESLISDDPATLIRTLEQYKAFPRK